VIEGYAEATVRFAAAYPPAPHDAATLYTERWMFHGPAYRGVVGLGPVGQDGIRGVLETGAAKGALLDNAGQLFGYWVMIKDTVDRMAMPIAIRRLELYGPHPAPGERLPCAVQIRRHDATSVVADLSLGRWCRIEGWEDRRFTTDDRLWDVMQYPERHPLAAPQPGGWVWLSDHYRAAPTRDLLLRRFMGVRERADYEKQTPLAQRPWLSSMIAAKDAVRDALWRGGASALFPVEIELARGADGRPIVLGRDLRVSMAHKGENAVALATGSGSPGIDIQAIEPDSAAADASTLGAGDDAWPARLTAARTAAARARGIPDSDAGRLRVTDRTGERLLVDGLWVDTRREAGHIVAWTTAT
jgi:hypothetical protein